MSKRSGPVLLALTSALLFGAATPASKLLLADLTPFQLAGLLYLGAALAMLPWVVGGRGVRIADLDRVNRRRLLVAVAAGGWLAPVLLLAGLRLAPAGRVSLLLNLEMLATAVLGVWLFHEHLHRSGWMGAIGVVLAGALLSGGDWPGAGAALLVAAACVCWGLDNHMTALIDGMRPTVSTFWKGAVAGVVNLTIGFALAPRTASGGQIGAALLVGGLSYGASIALYIRAAQQVGAVRAQAVFASAPFIGAALAYGVLGEPLQPSVLVAAALLGVSVSVVFAGTHAHFHRHPATEHVHVHRHDDGHHDHVHADHAPEQAHTHRHRHDEIEHAHPHWPDLHHRHQHG